MLEEALELFEEIGDNWGISEVRLRLGWMLMACAEFDRARELLNKALLEARRLDNRHAAAWSHFLCGNIVWRQRQDHLGATTLFEQSARFAEETHNAPLRGFVLLALAEMAEVRGDYAQARRLYEQVQPLFSDTGQARMTVGMALFGLGQVLQAQGDHSLAEHYFREVLSLAHEQGSGAEMAWLGGHGLWGLGALAALEGGSLRAAILLGAADTRIRQVRGQFLRDTTSLLSSLRAAAFERDVAAVQAQLDEAEFAAAFGEGQELPIEQAVAYASERARAAAPVRTR